MVSKLSLGTGLALAGGLALAYFALGGAGGIGRRIGGGLNAFGSNILGGLSGFGEIGGELGGQGSGPPTNEGVAEVAGITPNVETNNQPVTPRSRELLSLGGLAESLGLSGKIDVVNERFTNEFTTQPLGFIFDENDRIRTGTQGLGPATVAAQAALSQKFGIPTFDTTGALSTFGGLVASR